MLGRDSVGAHAAKLCNEFPLRAGVQHDEGSWASYIEVIENRAPSVWMDFVTSLRDPFGDRSQRTTNGLESPEFLPAPDLIELQARVDRSSRASSSPFGDAPVAVAEIQGFPTLLVGDKEDPAVVQVGTWIDMGKLESPIIQALRLSSWMNRLVVPISVVELSRRSAGKHVLHSPHVPVQIDGVGEAAERLLNDLDLGVRPDETLTSDEVLIPIDALNGVRTLSVARGELPSLNFRYNDTGLLDDHFDGQYLQHPLALLIGIARLTARTIATGAPLIDTLGLLTDRPGEVSEHNAAEAWSQITARKDLDMVVAGLVERLGRLPEPRQ